MTVEFGHCDPAGMVSPKRLFEYFDTGTWSLFEAALGIKRADFLTTFGILPLVDVRLVCRKAVKFGDTIEVASRSPSSAAQALKSNTASRRRRTCGRRRRNAGVGGARQEKPGKDQRARHSRRHHRAVWLRRASALLARSRRTFPQRVFVAFLRRLHLLAHVVFLEMRTFPLIDFGDGMMTEASASSSFIAAIHSSTAAL